MYIIKNKWYYPPADQQPPQAQLSVFCELTEGPLDPSIDKDIKQDWRSVLSIFQAHLSLVGDAQIWYLWKDLLRHAGLKLCGKAFK